MKRFILLSVIAFLGSCKNERPSISKLYDDYKSGVILIEYSYYLKLEQGNIVFFINVDRNGELIKYDDEDDAKLNSLMKTGTGFFISDTGEIVTNRHVITASINEDLIVDKYLSFYNLLIDYVKLELTEKEDEYEENYYYSSTEELSTIVDEYNDIEIKLEFFKSLNDDLKNGDYTLEVITSQILIKYPISANVSNSNYENAEIIKISEDKNVDLSILQLKIKKTPKNINEFFSITKIDSYNIHPIINDAVFMIGYNSGYTLAKTKDGIKSQLTKGNITKEPETNEILYSIPSLGGSSGSPIIDYWGNLVAINYAGMREGQSFNFGVPVTKLLQLYYGDDMPDLSKINNSSNKVKFAYKFEELYN